MSHEDGKCDICGGAFLACECVQSAYASPLHAAAEPVGQPVAWMYEQGMRRVFHSYRSLDYADGWAETPLYASPSAQPIAEHTKRWNVEPTDDGLRVCRGDHQSAEQCEWEYFVPKSAAQPTELTDDMLRYAMAAMGTGKWEDAERFRQFWKFATEAALKSAGKEST